MLDEGQSTSQAALTTSMALGGGRGDATAAPPPKGHKKTLDSFFKKSSSSYSAAISGLTDQQAIEAELKSYLLAPDADSESNPLAWWKIHCKTHPRVSLLARRYLCIPATNSASECVFSTGGNIVSCHRAALKPDAVDKLVFLAKNL